MKAIQEERRALEELATVNQMTIRKLEGDRDVQQAHIPEESMENILRLENTLKMEKQTAERLVKENKLLEAQIRKKDKEHAKTIDELEFVKGETGYIKGVTLRKEERDAKNQENKIAELQKQLQKLEEEQRTNKQVQKRKTQLIEQLSKELDNKKQLEEEVYQAQNAIKMKEREAKDIEEEVKTLKRIHIKKDKLISSLENEHYSDRQIRQLEGDKRFLQAEISKHTEQRRQQERAVRSQQIRIEQLLMRLDAITSGLRELKLDSPLGGSLRGAVPSPTDAEGEEEGTTEVVDIEVFELVERDLESIRTQMNMKDAIIQEKDSEIETLERKVEILAHAKRSEARCVQAERREADQAIEDIKRTIDLQQDQFRKQSEKLKAENARLRRGVGQR